MTHKKSSINEKGSWRLPERVSREACINSSQTILTMADMKIKQYEDVFRIRALEMDWDIGVMVYEPEESSNLAVGADDKKVGVFLLSGGSGDYKSMEAFALLSATKFGYKVATMTYPGRPYLEDSSRDWR